MNNPLPYDLHKCHKLQSSWSPWKSVWKFAEIELPSLFCTNNIERLSFVICLHAKDLLFDRQRHYFNIFSYIYQNVCYFPGIIWKEKKNKFNRKNLRGRCIILAIVKHPMHTFIIKVFRTIVFIFIVISPTFWPICLPAFFRCLSNLGTFTELRTTSFIETTGVACSDFVSHNRVQVLSIPVLLLACSEDWTCRTHGVTVIGVGSLNFLGDNHLKRCGNNNKDEDSSPKNLNDKNQQASSQKFEN